MPFECVSMRVWGCTALLLAGLMCVPEARAWEAVTDGLPDQAVVAVDKSRQRFFLMEKGKSRDYLCTTGQAQGDKQVRGDLKTPEGVYFVVRKRTERLDFEEYGGEVEERTRGWRAAWRRGEAGDGFIAPERAASIRKVERQEKRARVTFGPVRALEGPGYVVSWFAQRMASPDGGAETGVRRLYWEKQGDGEYRIVGMAWAD